MAYFFRVTVLLTLTGMPWLKAAELTSQSRQLVVCLANDANSFEGTLQLFHRDTAGHWKADGDAWPVLFARHGLAWGRGVNPAQPGLQKQTGDIHNPAGLFKLGSVFGYAPALPEGAKGWPYHEVTDRDAWIDDETLPGYNHLYTLPPGEPFPAWWEKERMHLGDSAYEWMVLIEHNYDDPVPAAGNEIFFHIRRGEHYRTAGCTTMAKEDLVKLIKWLQPGSNAIMVELARADYARFEKDWGLPPLDHPPAP